MNRAPRPRVFAPFQRPSQLLLRPSQTTCAPVVRSMGSIAKSGPLQNHHEPITAGTAPVTTPLEARPQSTTPLQVPSPVLPRLTPRPTPRRGHFSHRPFCTKPQWMPNIPSLRTAQIARHLSSPSSIPVNGKMAYQVRKIAAPHTLEHRVYIEKDGVPVSPFHDIPLYANAEQTVLNMIVEIPRWTNAKLEVSALLLLLLLLLLEPRVLCLVGRLPSASKAY